MRGLRNEAGSARWRVEAFSFGQASGTTLPSGTRKSLNPQACDLRILHSTPSPPGYIPPPALAPNQVVCGPNYPDGGGSGQGLSLRTPKGEYDIAQVIARLPTAQRPDLLVVRVGALGVNFPRNIGSAGCRAVLVIGDTHHFQNPIQTLLSYALAEPFEAVIFDYTRQHAHFFIEAGLRRVYWLPGFNVRHIELPRDLARDIPLSFIGQVGRFHPRRAALCKALVAGKMPLSILSGTAEEARALHARSRVSLNCSLNADLNLRVFEVPVSNVSITPIASGGCLARCS